MSLRYRPEIDGLRALAVVPVILFHAGFPAFGGGYVGVDIFFVISGYLITSILLSEMAEERFSLLGFYERRARRILPALFFMMLVCIPFAWAWMLPDKLENFGQSIIATTLFSNNILLYLTTSYWDVAAELKPMLHTWSLGVEEQYYILFPLFLMMIWPKGIRAVLVALSILFVVSLAIGQWGAHNEPTAAFYLLPARGWEILIGALAAFYLNRKRDTEIPLPAAQFLSLFGIILILYAIFAFDEKTPFPGFYALVPTVGTALIILFAQPGTWVGHAMSNRLLVGIGLISYSAYLWHQPLFAFARYNSLTELPISWIAGLFGLTFSLAYLSWRFVEKPFREKARYTQKQIFIGSTLIGSLIIGLGYSAHITQGFKSYYQANRTNAFQKQLLESGKSNKIRQDCEKDYDGDIATLKPCILGTKNQPVKVAVIGDSQSAAILPPVAKAAEQAEVSFVHFGHAGCPPLLDTYVQIGFVELGACRDLAQRQFEYVKANNIPVVILVARWSLYVHDTVNGVPKVSFYLSSKPNDEATLDNSRAAFERGLRRTIQAYRAIGVNIVLARQVPEQSVDPDSLIRFSNRETLQNAVKQYSVTTASHKRKQAYANGQFDRMRTEFAVKIIGFDDLYCWDGLCPLSDGDRLLYSDADHVSAYGSMRMQKIFETILLE